MRSYDGKSGEFDMIKIDSMKFSRNEYKYFKKKGLMTSFKVQSKGFGQYHGSTRCLACFDPPYLTDGAVVSVTALYQCLPP